MKIGVVLLAKNEQKIISEWLAFYLVLGFDRIHVFDNDSTDGTAALVRAAAGRVPGITLEPWSITGDFNAGQSAAYDRGLEIMRRDGVERCLFVDADEFLVSTSGQMVKDWLQSFDQFSAIALHWSFYGSSGHVTEPAGLTLENFLNRAPANFPPQSLCKSFVRVSDTEKCANPHLFLRDNEPVSYVDCNGGPVLWESFGQDILISPWRINHYFVRSKEWWARKVARSAMASGFVRRDEEWESYDRNEHYDPSALAYVPAVKAMLSMLGHSSSTLAFANNQFAEVCWQMADDCLAKFSQSGKF